MLRVDFYALEGPAGKSKSVSKGSISLDGKKLAVNAGSDKLLKDILLDPITIFGANDEEITYDPKKDPEGWLKNLHMQYKSYVLQATQAVDE